MREPYRPKPIRVPPRAEAGVAWPSVSRPPKRPSALAGPSGRCLDLAAPSPVARDLGGSLAGVSAAPFGFPCGTMENVCDESRCVKPDD